jgi:hypothetical protein
MNYFSFTRWCNHPSFPQVRHYEELKMTTRMRVTALAAALAATALVVAQPVNGMT